MNLITRWGKDINKSLRVISNESLISLFDALSQIETLSKLHLDLTSWGFYDGLVNE